MVHLQFETAEQLANALQRVSDPLKVLQYDGIVVVGIGVGVCFTLTVQHFRSHLFKSPWHTALLLAVSSFSLMSFALMCVNRQNITRNLGSMADLYHFDSISIISTFLLCSLTAYLSQLFFLTRVYRLYNRHKPPLIPILITSHVSLISGVILDIYGLCQPEFNASTMGEELRRVERWFERLLGFRGKLQRLWVMSTLACDLIICVLIIVALIRMKSNTVLADTKSLIGKFIVLVMETMVPPMIMAVLFAAASMSHHAGPGSWFRNTAALQSMFYWFAIVWVLRTRKRFAEKLNPPVMTKPIHITSTSGDDTEAGLIRRKDEITSNDEFTTDTSQPSGQDGRRPWTAGFYDGKSEEVVLSIDEALRGPDLLYDSGEGKEQVKGLNIMV